MNWPQVPQQIVTGVLNGGVIGLIALGIVLIYKSSEVFNFAQGHMLMMGAFFVWWLTGGNRTGEELIRLPLWAAVPVSFLMAAVLGLLIERFTLRPMSGQPLLAIILMTLGLTQLLQGGVVFIFGPDPKSNFPAPFTPFDVFAIPFPGALGDVLAIKKILVLAFVSALLATGVFALFFRFTRMGLGMRATADNHEVARSVGIKVNSMFGITWAIAGMIATAGGILLAMQSGVSPTLATVVLAAFPAILLGGLESLPGALIGGIFIGLAQALVQASTEVEVRNSAEIAPYILLMLVLLLRPAGLFGQKRIERI